MSTFFRLHGGEGTGNGCKRGPSMQAITFRDRAAGVEGMSLTDVPYPHLAENDVIVRVHAAGFTPAELAWPGTWTDRAGRDRTPSVPGHDLSGVVAELGYGTTGLSIGQRVFGLADWTRDGSLAEYTAVEARARPHWCAPGARWSPSPRRPRPATDARLRAGSEPRAQAYCTSTSGAVTAQGGPRAAIRVWRGRCADGEVRTGRCTLRRGRRRHGGPARGTPRNRRPRAGGTARRG